MSLRGMHARRLDRIALWSAAALEGAFLLRFLFLADFSNRLHVLLLLTAVASYSIVGVGFVALGAHVSRCTERVLKAIELAQTVRENNPGPL